MRGGVEALGEFGEPTYLTGTCSPGVGTMTTPSRPGCTRVVVTLAAEYVGTRVVLRHYDLPDDDEQRHYLQGWEM